MRQSTIRKQFDIPLSDERLAEIAREMSDTLESARILEENLKAAKEAAKGVSEKIQHVRELGAFIRNGAESKVMDCEIRYDHPEPGLKSVIRPDTGEIVDTSEMTGEELQGELSIVESGTLSFPPPPEPPSTPRPETDQSSEE